MAEICSKHRFVLKNGKCPFCESEYYNKVVKNTSPIKETKIEEELTGEMLTKLCNKFNKK